MSSLAQQGEQASLVQTCIVLGGSILGRALSLKPCLSYQLWALPQCHAVTASCSGYLALSGVYPQACVRCTGSPYSITAMADAVSQLIDSMGLSAPATTIVGYSLGARIALQLLSQHGRRFAQGVIVSGTAGMDSAGAAQQRAAKDDELAARLTRRGLTEFLGSWYGSPMWTSLQRHPRYGPSDDLVNRETQLGMAPVGFSKQRDTSRYGSSGDIHEEQPALSLPWR